MESKPGKSTKVKKPWKGEKRGGPAPARHIPWPEIFKHHISVVEGHLRMMEMIKKHTAEGTGNYTTIMDILKRCNKMLQDTKDATRSFIPPKNQRESVPLGSSSYSMYPGYSPEDVEYGKAAGEAGQAIGEMQKQGLKWEGPSNGVEYKVGQARGTKRKMLFDKENPKSAGDEDTPMTDAVTEKGKTEEPAQENGQPAFYIDTNPMPIYVPDVNSKSSKKRVLEDEPEGSEKKKSKKEKKAKEIVVETDDISAEVDANLQAKEEKAKAKEEKKRRRSSGGETEQAVKKSKKEKLKKRETESGAEGSVDDEGKKKKKKKSRDSE